MASVSKIFSGVGAGAGSRWASAGRADTDTAESKARTEDAQEARRRFVTALLGRQSQNGGREGPAGVTAVGESPEKFSVPGRKSRQRRHIVRVEFVDRIDPRIDGTGRRSKNRVKTGTRRPRPAAVCSCRVCEEMIRTADVP
jgi:hypothetical protein